jgi:hypothetical protein
VIDIGRVCFSLYENRLSENLNYSRICCHRNPLAKDPNNQIYH